MRIFKLTRVKQNNYSTTPSPKLTSRRDIRTEYWYSNQFFIPFCCLEIFLKCRYLFDNWCMTGEARCSIYWLGDTTCTLYVFFVAEMYHRRSVYSTLCHCFQLLAVSRRWTLSMLNISLLIYKKVNKLFKQISILQTMQTSTQDQPDLSINQVMSKCNFTTFMLSNIYHVLRCTGYIDILR